MSQTFYKGRTNNHLTYVMVDATDFATPESAVSAATKIKIYGKLRGQVAPNFVSSGAGSLTNDIVHVGASALGIYTIALAKADLSDASAAWYDQYIISLSATGCAYQALVVDGGIDASGLSDMASYLSGIASDLNSRITKAVATNSQLSDLQSDLKSYLTVMSGILSDTYSGVVALSDAVSDAQSDLRSYLAGANVGITTSAISDIASAVWATAGADPTTVPAVTAGMAAKLDWLTALARNKITQTATVQSLRNDADAADIASAAVSDDGTTFTRGEFA